MEIINVFYNEVSEIFNIEFSTNEDKDLYYRVLDFTFSDIQLFSSTPFDDIEDFVNTDDSEVVELLGNYLQENPLPEQLLL